MSKGIWMDECVQYNTDLSYKERQFLAEIIFFDKHGPEKCHASNGWFAKKHKLGRRDIVRIFASLKRKGYIICEYIRKAGEVTQRIIHPVYSKIEAGGVGGKSSLRRDKTGIKVGTNQSPINTSINTSKETTKEKSVGANKTLQKSTTRITQEFETFWQAYPKKVSRKEALKSWQRISPGQRLFDEIMLALEKHKAQVSWHKDNGRFIPNPATWLNAERWTDVINSPQAGPDYSAALARYTHDCTEEEAEELMKEVSGGN